MTELEIEIQKLESNLQGKLAARQYIDKNYSAIFQQQIDELQKQIDEKKQQLEAQRSETVYEHLSRIVGYSNELKACIEDTVAKLLDKDASNASDPGLLLGKIQCGKTRTFVGVMGLAFDRDIDVCVVLTKSDDGLVEQTRARMEYEFRDFISSNDLNKCCSIGVYKIEKNPNFSPFQINDQKNIFIVHKNNTRLKYLIHLFEHTEFKNKRVLIVDDEADFVSRTYYQQNNAIDAGVIALTIDRFTRIPAFCRYLQVTATPYSLFLQPDHTVSVSNGTVETFRPRFTTLVPIHENYIGGKHYFVLSQDNQSMYSYLKHIVSDNCMDRLLEKNKHRTVTIGASTNTHYADLRQALMSYFVASAIRQLQEKQRYCSSFFIHISTEQKDHRFEKEIVDIILNAWKMDVENAGGTGLKDAFDAAYEDFKLSNQAGNKTNEISIGMPQYNEVWNKLLDIFLRGTYAVQIVNSTTGRDMLGKDGQLKLANDLNIFIGGFKLDRGITIDHMLGFMYGRRPQNTQTDTVLQHHRMYGNRSKEDMAVTRLHTTQSLYQIMEWIDNMDHQLREVFVKAMQNPTAPVPLVTIHYNPQLGVIPCGRNKLLISDMDYFKDFKRITTFGFQTDSPTKLKGIIEPLDDMLQNNYHCQDKKPFLMDKQTAYQILKQIRSTFIYNRDIDNNRGMEWNEDEMIAAIEKYVPQDGNIWCYVATNRNMGRIKQNGNFSDAPEDGNTDTPIASKSVKNDPRPFLMLFRENGGKTEGWRDAPFYWPCLRLPYNIETCMYCK